MRVTVDPPTFDTWRAIARALLGSSIPPSDLSWYERGDASSLFDTDAGVPETPARPAGVPGRFLRLAETVACHRDPAPWALLYRLLWRLVHENRALLGDPLDDDVRKAHHLRTAVNRDVHHIHAFVRFAAVNEPDGDRYVAWYAPAHRVLRLAAPFFVERFRSMRWSILTPDESAHWDGTVLNWSEGVAHAPSQIGDALDTTWRAYYASVFNPARVNVPLLARHVPARFWPTMPELQQVPELVSRADDATGRMLARSTSGDSAREYVPAGANLETLKAAVQRCEGCPLHASATQPVFGEGPAAARVVLVGEQPGDEEDLTGRPFVGPAGQLLDRALAAAGIARDLVYVTNAVKHFKFEPRGKRRIHQTPRYGEVRACRPWLEAELQALAPRVVVCLGATASQALFGPQFRVLKERGQPRPTAWAPVTVATLHPSAVLRAEDPATADEYFRVLVADLALARDAAAA